MQEALCVRWECFFRLWVIGVSSKPPIEAEYNRLGIKVPYNDAKGN